jgi:hypothetical protein
MNAANLQIEGVLMAMAATNRLLVDKGILGRDELDQALAATEAALTGADRAIEDLSPASRDAIAFPVRLLRIANRADAEPDFQSLARAVGQEKGRYNDQE